jgi:phospholipid/cholesterol/gamma-HCH transport system substrate-binding protein
MFVLGLVAVVVVGVLFVGDGLSALKRHRLFTARLADASGLAEGAPVKMGGLTVGQVTRLELAYVDGSPGAVAELEVTEPYYDMVRADTRVHLETQGVLGDRYVALLGGKPDVAVAAAGAELATTPQLTMEQLTKHANDILVKVDAILADVQRFSSGLPDGEAARSAAAEVAATARAFSQTARALTREGGALDVLTRPESGAKVAQALEQLDRATTAIAAASAKVRDGEGTLGLLVNDPGLYDDAKSLLGRTNRNRMARSLVREALKSSAPTPLAPETTAAPDAALGH